LTELNLRPSDTEPLARPEDLRATTRRIVSEMPVFDMHTHLFPPGFRDFSRWGIDNLLTYHYLVAEVMRAGEVRPAEFRGMTQQAQADLIWDVLFVRSSPLSEATRGVIAVMSAPGSIPRVPTCEKRASSSATPRPSDRWISCSTVRVSRLSS
jgi:hypothetical protein